MNITQFFPQISRSESQKAALLLMEAALLKNVRVHKQLLPYFNAVQNALDVDDIEKLYIFESIRYYDVMPGMVDLLDAVLNPFATDGDAKATLEAISRYFQYVLPIEEQKKIIANSI